MVDQAKTLNLTVDTATFRFARKTSDSAMTSDAALANDAELLLAVAANEVLIFEAWLIYDATTTGDINVAFTVPAGATIAWSAMPLGVTATASPATVAPDVITASGTGRAMGGVGAGSKIGVPIRGIVVNGATAGNLQLQWAQRASDATATNVFANSFISARKVA